MLPLFFSDRASVFDIMIYEFRSTQLDSVDEAIGNHLVVHNIMCVRTVCA